MTKAYTITETAIAANGIDLTLPEEFETAASSAIAALSKHYMEAIDYMKGELMCGGSHADGESIRIEVYDPEDPEFYDVVEISYGEVREMM